MDTAQKLTELKKKLAKYRQKLSQKLIGHTGVVHEDAASELQEVEVNVLSSIVDQLEDEVRALEEELKKG